MNKKDYNTILEYITKKQSQKTIFLISKRSELFKKCPDFFKDAKNIKIINDSSGCFISDKLLIWVNNLLYNSVKNKDSARNSMICTLIHESFHLKDYCDDISAWDLKTATDKEIYAFSKTFEFINSYVKNNFDKRVSKELNSWNKCQIALISGSVFKNVHEKACKKACSRILKERAESHQCSIK